MKNLSGRGLRLFVAAIVFCAQNAWSQGTQKLPEIKFEKYTLPNGLTVITHEDHRLPLVSVDLWYHVGPLNERPGRTVEIKPPPPPHKDWNDVARARSRTRAI